MPSTTVFKTTEHGYNLCQIFERFTPRVCKALLGFHAFTGSDQTGRFHGFSKRSCWEIFTSFTHETITAFINLGTTDLNSDIWLSFIKIFCCRSLLQRRGSSLSNQPCRFTMALFFKKPVRISQDATHIWSITWKNPSYTFHCSSMEVGTFAWAIITWPWGIWFRCMML